MNKIKLKGIKELAYDWLDKSRVCAAMWRPTI